VNTCITCRHWVRHPHHPLLGDCAKGEPSGCAAGFWGTDRRVVPEVGGGMIWLRLVLYPALVIALLLWALWAGCTRLVRR